MGFLNNSTNNVIIDAVLTDIGRQALARNDGSFSLVKFALSDDEVDYTLIQKFGRIVGKEKIEKNTPILEAGTQSHLAQKYRLISISNPNLVRLPKLTLAAGGTNNLITLGRNLDKLKSVTIEQDIINETEVNPELRDNVFMIDVNNMFVRIANVQPDNINSQSRATYLLTRDAAATAKQGSRCTFTIAVQSLTDAQYTVWGQTSTGSSSKDIIRTTLRISGLQSGATLDLTIQISKSS